MTIEEIYISLNELAAANHHPFSKLQEIRNRHGFPPNTWSPFAKRSSKPDYAYHSGGRKELQFNFGYDEIDDETVFRYGVAFALKEDRTLHNSKAEFRPAINRFNRLLQENPGYLSGYHMWYYEGDDFADYFEDVRQIDDDLFQAENFIFIGKYFNKDMVDLDGNDLETILETYDYLLPMYEHVQFGTPFKEKRVARICWNDNGWVLPSGWPGKSAYKKTHEARYGYGHEEWLFDTGKLIDGYHYGFIEPVRKQQDAFTGNSYDISLYTIHGLSKKRYWVGDIHHVEVISNEEAAKVLKEYRAMGWLREMEQQIKDCGANKGGFSGWKGIDLFNIKFLPANLSVNDPLFEIPPQNPIHELDRYSFAHYRDEFELDPGDNDTPFRFHEGDTAADNEEEDTNQGPETGSYTREPKTVEIVYLHKAMSKALTKLLKEKHGNENVTREHPAGYGAHSIDIVVRDGDGLVFYELKTYPALKTSIREALGQLMEYALWTNHRKATKMVILTQPHGNTEEAEIYCRHLRETFNIPVYYQWFDHEANILSEEY